MARETSRRAQASAVAQIATLVAVDKHSGQFIGESARRPMTSIHPSATFLPQAQAFFREAIRPQILSLASETIFCLPLRSMTPGTVPIVPGRQAWHTRVPRARDLVPTSRMQRVVLFPASQGGWGPRRPSVEVGGEGSQIDLAGEKSERSAFLDQIEQTRRECERMGVN